MIVLDGVTVTYPDAPAPTLRDVDLAVPEGELCLVVGSTGSGKSTLLGAVCGLVPHFTGGRLDGRVLVAGRDTADHPPRELADTVGVVTQDPLSGFVTDVVEEELAYAMEQLAVPADVMRRRVEEVLDLLGLAELRTRALSTLSGGQQQRVAIASVLTAGPRILVLDEPTSALDPTAAEEVLAAVTRLVHDLGITVLVAEHRLERVAQYADRVLWVPGDGRVVGGHPDEVLAEASVAPPVVELGEIAGWHPTPRSVRDARRHAPALRERLAACAPPTRGRRLPAPTAAPALTAHQVVVRYGEVVAVRGVALDLHRGEVTALMGRNGSGKSSLLWALQGAGRRDGGQVTVATDGGPVDPAAVSSRRARGLVGLVPQTASDLLYLASVGEELDAADREADVAPGTTRAQLDDLAPGIVDTAHPRDLSEGQRLALVLAIQLVAAPGVLLLDEPTRGLDYDAKRAFTATVRRLAAAGRSVVVASHDVELVAATADRVVILAEGEVVVDGPTADVVVSSPAFAPQVAKVLHPSPWLTVDEVAEALGRPLRRRDRAVAT